ncbi:MAG: TlpA disulfide reductase family protein [Betaproteobacteria bacterium]
MSTLRMHLAILPLALAATTAFAAAPGDAAPAFTLPEAGGAEVALDQLKGRVVYVDFWASWCGPCKRSFPWMSDMQRKYGDGGLTVLAINVDKKRADAQKFLVATPGAFTIVYDPAGAVAAAYDVKGMPTSYLVDRAGRIVAVDSGFRDDAKAGIEARIRTVLESR